MLSSAIGPTLGKSATLESKSSKATDPAQMQNDFLKLLVTQVTNQDPMEPLKDSEFIGQIAQFSTLESIEKLNANFTQMLFLQQLTQGSNLIGKNVQYQASGDTEQQTGVVDSVQVVDGKPQLMIAGTAVNLDSVRGITQI